MASEGRVGFFVAQRDQNLIIPPVHHWDLLDLVQAEAVGEEHFLQDCQVCAGEGAMVASTTVPELRSPTTLQDGGNGLIYQLFRELRFRCRRSSDGPSVRMKTPHCCGKYFFIHEEGAVQLARALAKENWPSVGRAGWGGTFAGRGAGTSLGVDCAEGQCDAPPGGASRSPVGA